MCQLSDSALPVGGFVASGGLESAIQILNIKQLDWFLNDSLHTLAYSTLPFIRSVYLRFDLRHLMELDKEYEAFCGTNHVNKRASTTQGIAYLTLISKSFPSMDVIIDFKLKVRKQETAGHFRLSLVGPYEGQTIIFNTKQTVQQILDAVQAQEIDEAYQTSPIVDILQGSHDRLYTRIFNS